MNSEKYLFPNMPLARISNFSLVSTYLPSLVCQKCQLLSLSQVCCLKCHENFCFKCIQKSNNNEDEIPKPFENPVTSQIITNTAQYIQNQHYRAVCPYCEEYVILSSNLPKIFHKLYILIQFQCINRINGCPEECNYPDLKIHEAKCGYNIIICTNNDCKQSLLRKELKQHQAYCEAPQAVQCPECGTEIMSTAQKQNKIVNNATPQKQYIYQEPKQMSINNSSLFNYTPQKKSTQQNFQSPSGKIEYEQSPFSLQSLLAKSAEIMENA